MLTWIVKIKQCHIVSTTFIKARDSISIHLFFSGKFQCILADNIKPAQNVYYTKTLIVKRQCSCSAQITTNKQNPNTHNFINH